MNIRVDLNTPIKGGTEVVFRSPVDCSKVTGLVVYCTDNGNTTIHEFAFADAHGNNVGDIDHLFAENVVVKVILDPETNMAFVQNADTNAYLEWRFKDTIDKCCPSFTESGSMVTCEPVEGYPLEVTAEEGATITRCGKNLVPGTREYGEQTINGVTFTPNEDGSITINGTATANATYRFSYKGLKWNVKPGASYTLSFRKVSGSFSGKPVFVANYYLASGGSSLSWLSASLDTQTSASTKPCPDDLDAILGYINVPSGATCTDCVVTCQVELGVTATAYEPYREPETFAVGEPITANPGVNTIFADAGLVTVKGKADPVAIINKLTNAILSLGGNV